MPKRFICWDGFLLWNLLKGITYFQSNCVKCVQRWGIWITERVVYNRAIVYTGQNFLNVAVHVIIIDQWNQTGRLTKSRLRLFIAELFLSPWRQKAVDRRLSVKPVLRLLGLWQTVRTQALDEIQVTVIYSCRCNISVLLIEVYL